MRLNLSHELVVENKYEVLIKMGKIHDVYERNQAYIFVKIGQCMHAVGENE